MPGCPFLITSLQITLLASHTECAHQEGESFVLNVLHNVHEGLVNVKVGYAVSNQKNGNWAQFYCDPLLEGGNNCCKLGNNSKSKQTVGRELRSELLQKLQ